MTDSRFTFEEAQALYGGDECMEDKWLDFIATLVRALAWPAVVGALAFFLRKQLASLISSITTLKGSGFGGGFEAEFSSGVESAGRAAVQLEATADILFAKVEDAAKTGEARKEAEEAEEPEEDTRPSPYQLRAIGISPTALEERSFQLHQLVDVSPRACILESFLLIENAAQNLATEDLGGSLSATRVIRVIEGLVKEGRIPPEAGALAEQLRQLRNKAVHANTETLSADRAHEYVDLAAFLVGMLTKAAKRNQSDVS